MDPISLTASVIAIIQLTGSLAKLCGGYIGEVRNAQEEILKISQAITGLEGTLKDLQSYLQSDNGETLPSTSQLANSIDDCLSELQRLETSLNPGKRKTLMNKVGLQALKWPLKRGDVENIVENLERYKSSFILSLQIDQTSLMVGVAHNTDRINQHLDLAQLGGVVDAMVGSFSDREETQCLGGTRTELLQRIEEWALSPSQKCIFWLRGMAGTGKSTISRTVAKAPLIKPHLSASFFFKRGEGDRGNAKKFFPTLVRQLILWNPGLSLGVKKALDHDPDIASKSLGEQFEKLLLQPLISFDQTGQKPQTAVMVIDALDECEHDQDIRNIIRLLPLLRKAKSICFRIFLTSRPELPISLGFSEIGDHEYQDLALHEIPEEVTESDIRLFLQDEFAKIRRDRNISQDWPSNDIILELTRISVPLFISAATMCRYIGNSKLEPKARLIELLKDQARYVSKMDKTYMPILTRLLDGQESDELDQQILLQEVQDIIGVIILLAAPLSINALSILLNREIDQISNRLNSFRSVLHIPVDRDQPVRILHLSFRDFLVTSKTKFQVNEQQKHRDIAGFCFEIMHSQLKRDICDLENPYSHRALIDPQCISQHLRPELQYSCRYWLYHLEQSQSLLSGFEGVLPFLKVHFLHWVEVMSLLGLISEVIEMLDRLNKLIHGNDNPEMADFLHDAKRFILKNSRITDNAPLQIYCSGLIFAPRRSIIRELFKAELPNWIDHLPHVEENWTSELQTLEGHTGSVRLVSFSSDSRLLASSSGDCTICLWDTTTGALQHTLESYPHMNRSMAFSPDSRLLGSAADNIVRLWDTATGTLQYDLMGHSDMIRSVIFSPNGQLLASSSVDNTVRLWNMPTGTLQHTLKSYSDPGWSIAFSPNSQLLAYILNGKTVGLCDTVKNTLRNTLAGGSTLVNGFESLSSTIFSPNGQLLASVFFDSYSTKYSTNYGVWLWDTATGALLHTLEYGSSGVLSIAFSPNGQLLASIFFDRPSMKHGLGLWHTETGALLRTLERHSDRIWSIAFSRNGRLLASGSEDSKVKLWDTATGALLHTLERHSDKIWSIAFSPDGRLLASGSGDSTIRLWDAVIGASEQVPIVGHPISVKSVIFSPDGQLLASGSSSFFSSKPDNTVCLWNTATGTLRRTLESNLKNIDLLAFSPGSQFLSASSLDNTARIWDVETGVMIASRINSKMTEYKPSTDTRNLTTDLSALGVQRWFKKKGFHSSNDAKIAILGNQWVTLEGKEILWLPPEYRPTCFAVRDGVLAMGHASGRVSILHFTLK